jgi:peptidoglycan/LPS O-acetylase OafA/YrhL
MNSLHAVRALAALLVVLFHTQAIFLERIGAVPYGNIFEAGHHRVNLFFVLSGFIITYAHAKDIGRPDRLANFFYNRLMRLLPALWIVSGLAFAMYSLTPGGFGRDSKLAMGAVLSSILLLPQMATPLVNVTWTLTYEMFFYALFAIMIVNARSGFCLIVLWQALTFMFALFGSEISLPTYYLRSTSLSFGVGILCAWWFLRNHPMRRRTIWWTGLAFGIGLFAVGLGIERYVTWAGIPTVIGAGIIILALAELDRAETLPIPRSLISLGKASFAIYLVHFSVITLTALIFRKLGAPATWTFWLLCAISGVGAGLAFDQLVDQPIQQWSRQHKTLILGWFRTTRSKTS